MTVRTAPLHYVFTVEQCYGAAFEQLKPPQGFELTGEFRPVLNHEYSLCRNLTAVYGESVSPSLILRKISKRKRIIFEEVRAWLHEGYLYGEGVDGQTMFRVTGYLQMPKKLFTRREEEF